MDALNAEKNVYYFSTVDQTVKMFTIFKMKIKIIIILPSIMLVNLYEMTFKYERKEHLQCTSEFRIKGKFYFKYEKAMKECDGYENCFGIYDVGCTHTGFSLCINEDEWKEIRLYNQGSNRSCVHLKQKNSGIPIAAEREETDLIDSTSYKENGEFSDNEINNKVLFSVLGISAFVIVGIVVASVVGACIYKRRKRNFSEWPSNEVESINKQMSYSYDMPDISFALSENSSYQSCRLSSGYLFGYKREQVVDNPYYGVIECPISK